MKRFAALMLVFALAFTLTGCGETSTTSNVTPPEKTTQLVIAVDEYDYWYTFNGIFTRFESEHPEIDVVYEFIPDHGTDNITPEMRETEITRLHTQLMSGAGPDIYIEMLAPYSNYNGIEFLSDVRLSLESGVFCDMTPYLEDIGVDMDDFIAPIMEAGQFNGNQCIVPLYYDLPCIIANDAAKSRLGWDDGTLQKPDELLDSLLALSNEAPGAFVTTLSGYDMWFYRSAKCQAFNPFYFTLTDSLDYDTHTVNIDYDLTCDIIEKSKTLFDNIINANDTLENVAVPTEDSAAEFDRLMTEEPVCLISHTGVTLEYMLTTVAYMDHLGENINVYPICSDNGDIQALITTYAAVRANSEHKEEAAELIKLFLSEDMQKVLDYGAPVRKGLMPYILSKYKRKQLMEYSAHHPNNMFVFDSLPSDEMVAKFVDMENSITSACFPLPVEAGDAVTSYYTGQSDLSTALNEAQWYMTKSIWAAT